MSRKQTLSLKYANIGKYIIEKTTSRVNVAPTPLYKPAIPFSRYNCNANCRELSTWLPSRMKFKIKFIEFRIIFSPFALAICLWIFNNSIGVVTTIWHVPAPAPAKICRCMGRDPSLNNYKFIRFINQFHNRWFTLFLIFDERHH